MSNHNYPYQTKQWRKLRRAKLAHSRLCEHCLIRGRLVFASVVDHIKAIRNGGEVFPALDGLQSLCPTCHNQKTASDVRGVDHVVTGYDVQGNPIDASHPWHGGPINHEDYSSVKPCGNTSAYLVLNNDEGSDDDSVVTPWG